MRGYWAKGRKARYPYYECKNKQCSLRGQTIKKSEIEKGYDALLAGYTAKPELVTLAAEMFEDVWKKEFGEVAQKQKAVSGQKAKIEEDVALLTDKIAKAPDGSVLEEQLAKRLEEKACELKRLDSDHLGKIDWSVPYRTAAEEVLGTLKSPLNMWHCAHIDQKKELFFFFFDERLVYERQKGYRTAHLSPILRLFERLDNPDTHDVEMAGIEPACNRNSCVESTSVDCLDSLRPLALETDEIATIRALCVA